MAGKICTKITPAPRGKGHFIRKIGDRAMYKYVRAYQKKKIYIIFFPQQNIQYNYRFLELANTNLSTHFFNSICLPEHLSLKGGLPTTVDTGMSMKSIYLQA